MKQTRSLLIISIISLIFFRAAPVFAVEGNAAIAEATLTAYELDAVPADQPLDTQPRWRSSLGEIQQSAGTLLDTNTKLNAEARQLKKELDGLQEQADRQQAKNSQLSEKIAAVRAKAGQNTDQAEIFRFKGLFEDRNREVQAQKQRLTVLRDRRGSIESRLALMRLRVAELEVDRKARNVDGRFQDQSARNALRTENQGFRDAINKGEMQAKLLAEKADELGRLDNPYIAQTREILVKNADLRQRLADLQDKKQLQQEQLELVSANKIKLEKDRNVVLIQKLSGERDALQLRLKDNARKLEDLKAQPAGPDKASTGSSFAAADKLQQQNTVLEELIANIRENIALLEYKVATLKRYKDRNK